MAPFLSSAAMIWVKWFLSVLGGLGVFLFGMRTLSDAIRRASATPFRQFLSSVNLTSNWAVFELRGALGRH